jgi:hypothetical protein
MFDILSSTVQSEQSQHVNNLRFLHYTYWTELEVHEETKNVKKNKFFKTNYFLNYLFSFLAT